MTFAADSLPRAVENLFALNNYDIDGPKQVHGAEIDLVAQMKGNAFAPPVYIEVTVEYVDNDKYGKDLSKLAMIREQDRGAQLLIVSSRGFSLPVKERATATGIMTLTYDELFRQFEQFGSYVDSVLTEDSERGRELSALNAIYEEPDFEDAAGVDSATAFLSDWRTTEDRKKRWLIILGEYGTGKTALTKILQYRWALDYQRDASFPIPFRIELREFTRQFDANGLLHHFLDSNGLGHVPVAFVMSLIRSGRIVLLLDGYDEMAQYLHARERRTCLEALAQLSADGARGILTSRPNYFTEGEELQVFEILYASLQQGRLFLGKTGRSIIEEETRVDRLLERFLDRYERTLRDLTDEQTSALVDRALSDDEAGRAVVHRILSRVFRARDEGAAVSLSGKPVIITYLLEVVETLKEHGPAVDEASLTEWQVYKMIVDLLMIRDLKSAAYLAPEDRRRFLHDLAVVLSRRDTPVIEEDAFKDLLTHAFAGHLKRMGPDGKRDELERLFSDLRRSSTLTRGQVGGRTGWRFSHNSLREFLVAEHLAETLRTGGTAGEWVPVSDATRLFATSLDLDELSLLRTKLQQLWARRSLYDGSGSLLMLLWDGFKKLAREECQSTQSAITAIAGAPITLEQTRLQRLVLSTEVDPLNLANLKAGQAELYDVDLTAADLKGADFSSCIMENVQLAGTELAGATFFGALLVDVDLRDANVEGCDFRNVAADSISIVVSRDGTSTDSLVGNDALGYLSFHGARTDPLPATVELQFHEDFGIVDKVTERLSEQTLHQRRGIEQRGASARNVPFARSLVEAYFKAGYLEVPKARKDLVETTDVGRTAFKKYVETRELPACAIQMLRGES